MVLLGGAAADVSSAMMSCTVCEREERSRAKERRANGEGRLRVALNQINIRGGELKTKCSTSGFSFFLSFLFLSSFPFPSHAKNEAIIKKKKK